MTSPQHRIATSQMMAGGRMTSPVNPYGQQGMAQTQIMANQQPNRFIRPQMVNMQDRPRQTMMSIQQSQQNQQMNQFQQQQPMQVNRQNNAMYPNSPLGSPQPIISNTQQQQLNMDHIQNQRTMQLVQQRQMIQRQMLQQQQQSNQQQQQQNHVMSPIQQPSSPMLSSQLQNPPSSPMQSHIHFGQQQQKTMIVGGSPLMRQSSNSGGPINSPMNQESYMHQQQFMQQQQQQQHQIENHQVINQIDTSGGGGGGGVFNPIPLPPSFQRFGYIKLGLFGGTPMYTSFGKGAKRLPAPSGSAATHSNQTKKDQSKESPNARPIMVKKKTVTITKATIQHNKITSLVNQDYSEFDDGSSTASSSPGTSLSSMKKGGDIHDDIVVIDSSPDEKQEIIDYDDDNDKTVVGTEVSLSSVAQNVDDGNDMSVMYSATGSDFIVSSPLDEVVEEYPLFPCVVDYVDSDDSMKHRQNHDDDKHNELVNVQLGSPVEDERQSITIDSSDEDAKTKTPESPEYLEHLGATNSEDHFQATDEDLMSMGSEIIIIDSSAKTPEDSNFSVSGKVI